MTLDAKERQALARLAKRDRVAREKATAARDEFFEKLVELRGRSTVRELAEATGLSFQRIHELTTVRNRRTKAGQERRGR